MTEGKNHWSKETDKKEFGELLTSLAIIFIVPAGLLIARLMGFSPTTQIYTALETTVANLCWVPPLVGWLKGESN